MSKLSSGSRIHSLPLELRQTIYHLASADSTQQKEIRIKFTLSKDATDGTGTFDAPPILNLLQSLNQVSSELHEQALEHLTSAVFCWVLVSEEQPHMYLLRALRKLAPAYVLGRIKRIRLSEVAFFGHTCPWPLPIVQGRPTSDITALSTLRSAYIQHLGLNYNPNRSDNYFLKAKNDIAYGMPLVPLVFSGVLKVDIELDIADLIFASHDLSPVKNYVDSPSAYWAKCVGRFAVQTIGGIGSIRSAANINVHIYWKDLGIRKRFEEWEVDDETMLALKKSFIEHVRTKLVAKSITGHS